MSSTSFQTDLVKSWLQSKAVWGGILASAGGMLALGHYTFSADDQKTAVDLISNIISAVGGLYAIYGRIVASRPIG